MGSSRALLDRLFHLSERRTSVRIEVLGGVTTFVTMAYIIVVNPAILKDAGMETGPSTVATILTAVFGSLLMGLYANRPIAVAPYMGENAFIAFTLTALAIGWQVSLGAVFVSGLAFLVITLLGIRTWLANSISSSMKHSFVVGIGLFLTFIGLNVTGIVAQGPPDAPLKIGDFREPKVRLAIAGFVVMSILLCRRVRGGILLGMAVTAAAGMALRLGAAPEGVVAVPFSAEYDLGKVALQLRVREVLQLSYLPVLLTLFLMSFLDTLGTLAGVGAAGDMLDEKGDFPQVERPMMVDALSCVFASLVGTSTSGAYIESAAGIRDGARTGLAAVTTAVLFAAALFFLPLVKPLQEMKYVYGPALIVVGMFMLGSVAKIAFEDLTEVVPAFTTIAMMVFTYNVGNGLTAGLVLYPVIKLAAGRYKDLNAGSLALALLCLIYYLFGLPH
jgi:AGZA family xanthine/uracil permease-like MFS transporter